MHTVELREALPVTRERLASESTVRRVLRAIAPTALEERLAHLERLAVETPTAGKVETIPGETLQGQALDGKALRGARAYGTASHLVSLVQHGSGLVLAETAVAEKSNLYQAIQLLFDQPPWLEQERAAEYQAKRFPDKGHGRHEVRTLECRSTLKD